MTWMDWNWLSRGLLPPHAIPAEHLASSSGHEVPPPGLDMPLLPAAADNGVVDPRAAIHQAQQQQSLAAARAALLAALGHPQLTYNPNAGRYGEVQYASPQRAAFPATHVNASRLRAALAALLHPAAAAHDGYVQVPPHRRLDGYVRQRVARPHGYVRATRREPWQLVR